MIYISYLEYHTKICLYTIKKKTRLFRYYIYNFSRLLLYCVTCVAWQKISDHVVCTRRRRRRHRRRRRQCRRHTFRFRSITFERM